MAVPPVGGREPAHGTHDTGDVPPRRKHRPSPPGQRSWRDHGTAELAAPVEDERRLPDRTAVPLTTRPHSQPDHHTNGVRPSGTSSLGPPEPSKIAAIPALRARQAREVSGLGCTGTNLAEQRCASLGRLGYRRLRPCQTVRRKGRALAPLHPDLLGSHNHPSDRPATPVSVSQWDQGSASAADAMQSIGPCAGPPAAYTPPHHALTARQESQQWVSIRPPKAAHRCPHPGNADSLGSA